jgi:hypothetical protein
MDNTYKTNKLGFPLSVVTAQTNVNSIASVAFGLVGNERREGFDFLATGLRQLQAQIQARAPKVIITERDDCMRDAFKVAFPEAQLQLCRFHIFQNVRLQVQKKGKWKKKTQASNEEQQGGAQAQEEAAQDDEEGLRDV